MKKILHIVSSLNTGGAEKFVLNLSAQQTLEGKYVEVLSFGKANDAFQELIVNNGVNVINISGSLWHRLRELLATVQRFDIIHIHSPAVIRALLPIFFRLKKYKVIYTIHGEIDPNQSLLKVSHQAALFYLTHITAVSEPAKQSVKRRYGWTPEKVGVINNGVNVMPITDKNLQLNTPKIRLGIASRLIELKNVPLLFDAIKRLPYDSQAQLMINIFGDGPEKENLEKRAQSLNDLVEIKFFGNVVNEQDIYNNIDVLVLCSKTEGLPMSILEAMGYGKPVIATMVGAIPKVINDNTSGWLFKSEDPVGLSNILEKLVSQPDLISNAAEEAYKYVNAEFSIKTTSDSFNELYGEHNE